MDEQANAKAFFRQCQSLSPSTPLTNLGNGLTAAVDRIADKVVEKAAAHLCESAFNALQETERPEHEKALLTGGMCDGDKKTVCLTPLMKAVITGDMDGAQALIARRAEVSKRNDQGSSALSYAITTCRPQMVRLLLKHGADAKNRFPIDQGVCDKLSEALKRMWNGGDKSTECYYDYLEKLAQQNKSKPSNSASMYYSQESIAATQKALVLGILGTFIHTPNPQQKSKQTMQAQAVAHMAILQRLREPDLFIRIMSYLSGDDICNASTLKYIAPYLNKEQLDAIASNMPVSLLKQVIRQLRCTQSKQFAIEMAKRLVYRVSTECEKQTEVKRRDGASNASPIYAASDIEANYGHAVHIQISRILQNKSEIAKMLFEYLME